MEKQWKKQTWNNHGNTMEKPDGFLPGIMNYPWNHSMEPTFVVGNLCMFQWIGSKENLQWKLHGLKPPMIGGFL